MFDSFYSLPITDQACVVIAVALFAMMAATILLLKAGRELILQSLAISWGLSGFMVLASFGYYAANKAETAQKIMAQRTPQANQVFALRTTSVKYMTSGGFIRDRNIENGETKKSLAASKRVDSIGINTSEFRPMF